MELKQSGRHNTGKILELLIVPYGIETQLAQEGLVLRLLLLIVPYGIETPFKPRVPSSDIPFNRTIWN